MDKETLIKELTRLAEANELTNPLASAILYTLATVCGDKNESALLTVLASACDRVNDFYINQLKQFKNES